MELKLFHDFKEIICLSSSAIWVKKNVILNIKNESRIENNNGKSFKNLFNT